MLEWIRFALVALFFAAGLIVLFISILIRDRNLLATKSTM